MGAACANAKMNQTVPLIKITNGEDQTEKKQEGQQQQQRSTSSREQNITKLSTLSKQVSNISSDGVPVRKQTTSRMSISGEDREKKPKVQGKNQGQEQLLKQREFILEKFLNDIQLLDKQLMSDVIQMLRFFLSHLEQSNIYWTKVWLINKNDYSIVVGFTNNIGESRKIRILYTKQIELVANLLDNYLFFQQFASYKIHDFSFRLNKKHNNFYVFSEQEYCDVSLENIQLQPEDIQPLLEYLLNTIQYMHQNFYVHSGIKPSNVYMIYHKQKVFKLDLSFSAFRFSRRLIKNKIKDFRANLVNDLEDIAILIINSFYKGSEIRQQLKQKNIDFANIIESLYQKQKNVIESYIKDIILLLYRNRQYLYDLKATDYVQLLKCHSTPELKDLIQDTPSTSNNNNNNSNTHTKNVLFEYSNNKVVFYHLTSTRNQKSYTQYELVDQNGQQINIIKGSAYIQDNKFYFAYENMIGMISIKLSSEQLEDTLEMLQISLRQYLATKEQQKKERIDSAQKNYQLQLQINQHSPTTQIEDQFKFRDTAQTQKQPNKNFHDRIYFTPQNLQEIFSIIDVEQRNYITAQQFYDFLQQQTDSIDNSLLQQLLFDKIQEIVLFFSDKNLTFHEFLQIFSFRSKQQLPIYKKIVKPLKQAQNVKSFTIINNTVHYYDGQHLYNDDNQIEIEYDLKYLTCNQNQLLIIGIQDGCLLINTQYNSIQTDVKIMSEFGFYKFNDLYFITQQNELILYSLKQKRSVKLNINGISSSCNLIYHKYFILYLNDQNVYRIFLSYDKWCITSFNVFEVLFEHGRLDQKIKLKQISTKQNSSDELIGVYSINKVHYPITNQTPSLFRILSVSKEQQNYILIQRIVHVEFESFDECYQVCKYLDPYLLDFFLSMEQYDGKLRLNYIIENCELIQKEDCNFNLIKRCVKKLNELRSHDIFVQDMHPNNVFITPNSVIFASLIYKTNIPSIYQEKSVPFMSSLEYMEPKSFLAFTQNLTQNQIFINPSKANIYSLGLIFLRLLSNYQIKNTKEQQFYLMEINLALQQFQFPNLKPLLEEMLKENEEQRYDSYQLIQFIRKYQKLNQKELFFISQPLQLLEQQQQALYGYQNNTIYQYQQVFKIYMNILSTNLQVLCVQSNDEGQLILLVKSLNQKTYKYLLLYITLSLNQYEQQQQHSTLIFEELVNFQKFAEEDQDEYDNNQLQIIQQNCQHIQSPHVVTKEVQVPIFDLQNVNECTYLINGEELYFFGFGITNEIRRVGSRDCFVYMPKRNLFKKVGYRTTYYEAQALDFGEYWLLLEKNSNHNKIRIQSITKAQFQCTERLIKLKNSEKVFYFKYLQNVIAISNNLCWYINIESFKAFEISCDNIPQSIISMQNTQNNTILTQDGVSTLQFDGNVLKIY
ncbi:unnamed protein product (macronuclear) [Paramecium tetraurelia]|uniref:Protein kinase domain-containing protein n=1 Tax=Paramecium tetraurelia TaxID=5888 RepID=A0CGF0_PARTE|nr:uncharacterized protein GSPATT00007307001 [Paramecium tetraurelia]CAK69867.1 unnamed protein product [Paramecium tetraurelia]|eukprot:XP_001437264.1 hypothetical protein (macronuclear) [Paramecium tetraurelia strain d4-2]